MKRTILLSVLTLILFIGTNSAGAQEDRYKYVIEESFYVVKPENKEKFVQVYKEKLMPFWNEMQKRGIIIGEYRLYSQRLHTLDPLWTYKTVVAFPNYAAVDKWLELRDEVYDKLFPGEGGYKAPRKEIDTITELHWDEFIREIPLKN
jgi:hypothetical protein